MPESSSTVTVTFLPSGRQAAVLRGTSLLEAAVQAGLDVEGDCGGRGTCGKCRVRVIGDTGSQADGRGVTAAGTAPLSPPAAAEERQLPSTLRREGWRLACQTRVLGPVRVEAGRGPGAETGRKDALTRLTVEKPLTDSGLAKVYDQGTRATTVTDGGEVITREPGDTREAGYALAVDIGTTTVVATLLDLFSGRALATASATNAQNAYGADVISRITHATTQPRGTRELQARVIGVINGLIDEVTRQAGGAASPAHIYTVAVVGNTTMTHLFLGVKPDGLSQAPYEAAFTEARAVKAGDLGLNVPPTANVRVLPGIASFLGADTVGVALATRLAGLPGWTLAIDIGTNGELLLAGDGKVWACSTAAGPAFEGAQISSGMRASPGAIERVRLGDGDLELGVIGGGRPAGICGSGLIDAVALLLETGIMDPSGRLRIGDELAGVPPALRERVVREDGRSTFVLVGPSGPVAESGAGAVGGDTSGTVVLSQADLRQVQLGKGAIQAGGRL
ncbi:MAG: ASKHA domain-containing protein, partial [Bacillota bacterium]